MYIREKRLLKWALYSIVIYIFFFLIYRPQGINVQKFVITSLLLFSVIALITICVINRKRLKEIPRYARFLFYLIVFWGGIVIMRSFSLSVQDWVSNFGNINMGLSWIVPVTLILGLKIENWNLVFKTIFFMFQLMFFLFFISFFYNENYNDWVMLIRPVNFILLIGLYHFRFNDKIKSYLIIVIYIIVNAVFSSRRIDLLFLFLTIALLLMDKLLLIRVQRSFLKYILFGFVVVLTIIFTVGYEFISNIVASVIEFEETRIFLFNELFEELAKTSETFIGRGSLGTYYSEYFEGTSKYWENMGRKGWAGDSANRIGIEVGYLQMILKGGYILLILNISIAISAAYKAIFKAKSKFIKRLGYFILLILILSLVEFPPKFTPIFIIFWMAIGTVLNKKYRMMSDVEIKKRIRFNK